jgi:hypothetical protein
MNCIDWKVTLYIVKKVPEEIDIEEENAIYC